MGKHEVVYGGGGGGEENKEGGGGGCSLTSAVAGWVDDGPRPSHLLGGAVAFSTVVVGNAGRPGTSHTCSKTDEVSRTQRGGTVSPAFTASPQ